MDNEILCYQEKGEGFMLLRFEQVIPEPREKVVSFFSDVKNRLRISPRFPRLRLAPRENTQIRPGEEFHLSLDFFVGSLSWRTVIDSLQEDGTFTDTMRSSMFREWRHTHSFEGLPGGTRICDEIECTPVWWFAPWAWLAIHSLFVVRKKRILAMAS